MSTYEAWISPTPSRCRKCKRHPMTSAWVVYKDWRSICDRFKHPCFPLLAFFYSGESSLTQVWLNTHTHAHTFAINFYTGTLHAQYTSYSYCLWPIAIGYYYPLCVRTGFPVPHWFWYVVLFAAGSEWDKLYFSESILLNDCASLSFVVLGIVGALATEACPLADWCIGVTHCLIKRKVLIPKFCHGFL